MARQRVLAAALVCLLMPRIAQAGSILVDFFAAPGTGFADPTPAAPVGGNPGVTVGEQRIYVFLQAAAIWTQVLKPTQDIYVAAQFTSLGPNVLGSAGPRFIWSNFPGAELPNTWYFDSLADNLTGSDLSPHHLRHPGELLERLRLLSRLRQQRSARHLRPAGRCPPRTRPRPELRQRRDRNHRRDAAARRGHRTLRRHLLAVHDGRDHGQDVEHDDRR
jgi:hypothetical protein